MRTNVYARELKASFNDVVEKDSEGVHYYGLQVNMSADDCVTFWATSREELLAFAHSLVRSVEASQL